MSTAYLAHITSDGDRWDLLAWRYYRDATGYERIMAANPTVDRAPVLACGIRLLIPVIETPDTLTEDLPPWKR
jgi:phage tail protein X